MKKVLSIVLSIVMVLCMMPAMAFADTAVYSDIAGAKCEAAVEELSELGVVTGYPDGTYKPEAVVTRAEMAKLIVTALGLAPTAGTSTFKDMDGAKWAIPYVGYAESLGIIEGYGNGMFGPNDTVTYDQAITMVVRALGYTEACNEMQGQWPAVFVLKANALNILRGGLPTGAAGATRGDVARLLANSLNVPMVYADKDGETHYVQGDKTMRTLLTKGSGSGYYVVNASDVADATKNIRAELGAAAKLVWNEDGEVISVSDVKTTFLTGTYNGTADTFKVGETTYKVADTLPLKALNPTNGKAVDADYIPTFVNGASPATTAAISDGTWTLAVTLNGSRITGIYSAQTWTPADTTQVKKADIDQIEINKTLLGESFDVDDNDAIDTNSFLLVGVDSLDEIAEDNIVAVYDDGSVITKVEVGTKVVTGKIEKVAGTKYYIDGVAFEQAATPGSIEGLSAGNEVSLYLNYAGKIFVSKLVDGTAGNYAVIMDVNNVTPATGTFAGESKMQLFTAEGDKVYVVNSKKFVEAGLDAAWATLEGEFVTFSVNDANEITKVVTKAATTVSSTKKITKQGYLAGTKIADNALIIQAPVSGGAFVYTDAEDMSVIEKSALLGAEITRAEYLTNNAGQIIFMVVDDGAVATDKLYGIVTGTAQLADSKTEVNFFINSTKYDGKEATAAVDVSSQGALYLIKQDAKGVYEFTPETAVVTDTTAAAFYGEYVVVPACTIGGIVNTTKAGISSDAVVYVYDISADTYTIGSTSVLKSSDVTNIAYYSTAEATDDAYGLINYIVVTKN